MEGVSGETPSTSVGILPQEPTADLTNDDVCLKVGFLKLLWHFDSLGGGGKSTNPHKSFLQPLFLNIKSQKVVTVP